jgi:SPOR domain
MCLPVRATFVLLALTVLAAGCAGNTKSAAYPIPPLAAPGEDTPSDEVSKNLSLALGSAAAATESFEEKRDKVPRALVGDRRNAVYSGQRLTGAVTAPAAAATSTPPALAKAPPPVPRVPVERQAASAGLPAAPPITNPTRSATPAVAKPLPAVPPAPTGKASDAGRVTVQLAAFRTRANAEGGWQRLRAAHPDQLGDRALIVRETDLGDRGIYYRVRTGPFADIAAAKAFCAKLLARDQDCVVKRAQ